MSLRLSEHFLLDEMTRSATAARLGLANVPDVAALANLGRLAQVLEQVRALAGGLPLRILSGYRSPALNAAVGGHARSYHLEGLAADFDPPAGMTHDALQQAIVRDPTIAVDLVLEERAQDGAAWIHLQIPRPGAVPRRRVVDAELDRVGGVITRVSAG